MNASFLPTGWSKFRACDLESRTKFPKILKNVLPLTPNSALAALRVEQNHPKLRKCSTQLPLPKHFGLRLRANLRNHVLPVTEMSGAVIEQLQCSTAFVKITAVYGQIDENWEFVRKWSSRKVPITDKMVKNSLLSVKIQPVWTRFYGQMIQKAGFVRKSSS